MNIMKDKIRGVFTGVALGDALGAPHEFRYHKSNIYTGNLKHRYKLINRWRGPKEMVIGQTTDDTEMTLTLARSLIRYGKYNEEDVILNYEQWATGTTMLGINTRTLFKNIKTVKGFRKRWEKKFSDLEAREKNQSNGSLMRCSPLAFIFDDAATVQDCSLTNPSSVNIESNLAYVRAVRLLVLGHDKNVVFEHVLEQVKNPDVRIVLNQAKNNEKRDVTRIGKGWVLHALYCAFWALINGNDYQTTIDHIIRLSGDTDTNAAIAGAMLGASMGYIEMMKEEKTPRNLHILMNADTSEGDNPRDERYTIGPQEDFEKFVNDFYVKIAKPNLEPYLIVSNT